GVLTWRTPCGPETGFAPCGGLRRRGGNAAPEQDPERPGAVGPSGCSRATALGLVRGTVPGAVVSNDAVGHRKCPLCGRRPTDHERRYAGTDGWLSLLGQVG